MRAPVSWIREYADLPADVSTQALADRLTALGLKLEALERPGEDLVGPLVLGRVLSAEDEPQKNGKVIRWCSVDVGGANGTGEPQGIVCGAHNFAVGDLVVVVLPGATLPGGFEISARKTYGHVSAGMICSARELGLGEDHDGIIVLPSDLGQPGDDAIELLAIRDDVIEMEINPDRAYALSLRGVAREAALGLGAPFTDPAQRPTPPANDDGYPVVVEDPPGCPVFVTRTVTGFDPSAPTPPWLARRVQLAGMRPISLAVDVTNYVMLELGQPIHGYDGDKLTGPIRVRRARRDEHLTTLDGVDRTLSVEDLLICDDSGPIGLAGVMGGETTELSGTTSRVVIEAAHFDPVSIFRTQRRHKLPSEASKRFERGVDPRLPQAAADRVAELLVRLGGGTVEPGVTVVGEAPEPVTITIDTDLPERITGMPITAETTVAHLRAVGCEVTLDGDRLHAVVPSWRPDLTDPFDLVEEVARIVGYEDIPSVLPAAPGGRGLTASQLLRRKVGRTLAGAGFVEVVSFPFVGSSAYDALRLPADDPRRESLRLANPLSNEQPLMTTTLLPGLLETGARNAGRGQPDVALFETATVTRPRGSQPAPILPVDRRPTPGEWDDLQKALPDQPLHLALLACGDRERAGWWGPGRPATWSDAVQAVRDVAQALGVEVHVRSAAVAPWHPGRCAEVLLGEEPIGHAGELHPKVCQAFGLPARSAAAEVDLDALLQHAAAVRSPEFSTFPVAKIDLALVVGEDVTAEELRGTLVEGAGELLESVRLFDVYTGEQVGAGRRSLAFALRLRAPDRTLTDEEVAAVRASAVALAEERHGAVLR
ncbi:phenylalanine--tRNA ligase subunit beta [Nocardioides marmoribigeumensis]|uniref:Phenylalanine--tRNA ligase beta subunit n=1 Tax=Nocardioides marmoribigeumensis TaxID=433649 RepID=A0ABU2BQR0_9ACTN|nr:phenylalanine--tRNA ligase subunit beta [Nocardioides marmoribigeumensis]MDR7360960.1 phenylalanyl-tRNA synthetase beta chain [Nocardioides marmoribigeumensis]